MIRDLETSRALMKLLCRFVGEQVISAMVWKKFLRKKSFMTFLPVWKNVTQNLFFNKRCIHHDLVQATTYLNVKKYVWWWWWIIYVVWLTDERRSLISSRSHCQRFSPSRISDTPRAGYELAQNLSSGFDEWSCAIVTTTTPRFAYKYRSSNEIRNCAIDKGSREKQDSNSYQWEVEAGFKVTNNRW